MAELSVSTVVMHRVSPYKFCYAHNPIDLAFVWIYIKVLGPLNVLLFFYYRTQLVNICKGELHVMLKSL
jgi:hypothetical protein